MAALQGSPSLFVFEFLLYIFGKIYNMDSQERETNEATRRRRVEMQKQAEFYKTELDLIAPYRDYMKCKVEIMQLNLMHEKMVEERENWESLHKKEGGEEKQEETR
jgi:hypothetical protein